MKNKLLTFAGVLTFLAMLGHFYAEPILAQVRAALVQNVDEPGRHPFALRTSNSGPFATWTIPPGQRYVIEAFSAGCAVDNPATLVDVYIQTGTVLAGTFFSAGTHFVTTFNLVDQSGSHLVNFYRGSETTRLYADPGSTLVMYMQPSPGTATVRSCDLAISGYSITMP